MELEIPAIVEAEVDDDRVLFPCPNCDIQMVHRLAQLLLSGLATACVDSTTFFFFSLASARDSSSSSVVAVETRKELLDYITHRSTSIILDNTEETMSMDPSENLSIFLDDFASTKRNVVVGWLGLGLPYLSDSRDDRIDDLVQEMETTRFWPIHAREAIARSLLLVGNLDVSGRFHCREKLERKAADADGHVDCSFRPVRCQNQGCRAEVSALRAHEHDEVCPLKLLPCEQHCELSVIRSQMDRHCITSCPMKLTNCPFYQLGCESAFPSCNLESHCAQFLQSHLRKILLTHVPVNDRHDHLDLVEKRLLLLEKCDSHATLRKALDVRSLTKALAELEKSLNGQT